MSKKILYALIVCYISIICVAINLIIFSYKVDSTLDNIKVATANIEKLYIEDTKRLIELEKEIDKLKTVDATPEENTLLDVLTPEDTINQYVFEVCSSYENIDPYIVQSIIYHESSYNPKATNGYCHGLMQIYEKWHIARMDKLGVTDLYDPKSNIKVGVDILNDYYIYNGESIELALMLYNMNHNTAFEMYATGEVSSYAISVLDMASELRGE